MIGFLVGAMVGFGIAVGVSFGLQGDVVFTSKEKETIQYYMSGDWGGEL